jgi:hypothetical protein
MRMRVIAIRRVNNITRRSAVYVKQLHFLYELPYFRLIIASGQIFVDYAYCVRANMPR